MKKTSFSPIQVITITTNSNIVEHRFIDFYGNLANHSQNVLGISYLNIQANDYAPVITLGTAIIEASEDINVGDEISCDKNGKAKLRQDGEKINGRAINATLANGYFTILLTP
jgi:hypothetical protein